MTTAPVTRPPQTPATLRMTPGRWAALAIGVPIALAFIGWTGFSLVATIGQASFPVNATIPIHGGHLVASLDGSDITVHQDQVKSGNARLTGTVQYSLIRPRFTVAGSDISVDCRLPTGNCGLNATLDVPPATAVQLTTGGGNMQVSGIQSDVTLDSGGGEVAVSGVGGTANVSTGGGNVSASDLGGILKFSTGGGDLSGDGLFAPGVTTDSGGGNVALVFTKVPANLDITSGGGDITILLPRGSARYDITSSPGGGSYTASVPADPASGNKIKVDSGGGNISIAES
jgi:Putative adhesin